MRVDLLLQHLDIGIPEQQLLFIVFIPQSLYIGFHFVKADMQLPDLIGTETVIVVSGVLRILESLSEAADLLYQKIQMVQYPAQKQQCQKQSDHHDHGGEQDHPDQNGMDRRKERIVILKIQIIPSGTWKISLDDKGLSFIYGKNRIMAAAMIQRLQQAGILFRMVSLLWVKLRISCKQDKTGMRGERISGILQGITDQLVQVDHYVQVSQMIQGQMAKLPDIPVKYDGIPGGSRCTPAGTPLAGCCIFCQFLQRKSIQIGSISHTDQCVVRKYQTDGFDIVVIKNIRIESLIYRLLSLGITDTGGSIHDIGEIRLNDGIGQDPGRTGFHGLHSCRDEGRYIIQRLCIGSIQLTGIILGKKLNAHNKSKEHKKQCR